MLASLLNTFILLSGAEVTTLDPGTTTTPGTAAGSEGAATLGYSSVVVFGDSFSDNGNGAYRISNKTWPLVPPYYQGRFSNGPVWAEYLAANLSLPLLDYAVGGATTSNALVQGFTGPPPASELPVPSVADQVSCFLSALPPNMTTTAPPTLTPEDPGAASLDNVVGTHPLVVLWAGANDVFFNPNVSAAQSALELAALAARLRAVVPGATLVTVASPDLSRLPYAFYADFVTKARLRAFTDLLALLLAQGAGTILNQASTKNVDLRNLFDQFEYFAAPQHYGFAPLGKYSSCLVGVYGEGNGTITQCDDAGEKVYWDEYHPTTQTHSWIAQTILDALS